VGDRERQSRGAPRHDVRGVEGFGQQRHPRSRYLAGNGEGVGVGGGVVVGDGHVTAGGACRRRIAAHREGRVATCRYRPGGVGGRGVGGEGGGTGVGGRVRLAVPVLLMV